MTVAEKAKMIEEKYGVSCKPAVEDDRVSLLAEQVSILSQQIEFHDKLLEDITKLIEYFTNNN